MDSIQKQIIVEKPLHLGSGSWTLSNLNKITILMGKNGSGKSQILRNIRKNPVRCLYVSPERSGEIIQNSNFINEDLQGKSGNRRLYNSAPNYREEVVSKLITLLTLFGSIRGRKKGVESDNDTLSIEFIEESIGLLIPEFSFKITTNNAFYELTRRAKGSLITSVNVLSSGETNLFSMALDVLITCFRWTLDKAESNKKAPILLIDEPDTHLHWESIGRFSEFILKILREFNVQILLATHNITLLSSLASLAPADVSVIYINALLESQTAIRLDESKRLLMQCLGGHILANSLWGAPLLLVEGDDDYKIWSLVARSQRVELAIISCSGASKVKEAQKTLEKVFSCLASDTSRPNGFALLDGHESFPTLNADRKDDCVKFIKLCCHEIENLYLADEVLATMDLTWEEAKEGIRAKASKYESKASLLLLCDLWDRKTHDIKPFIRELAEILDSKAVPWTSRIGQYLASHAPEGQIAEFLGSDLVQLLAPNEAISSETANSLIASS